MQGATGIYGDYRPSVLRISGFYRDDFEKPYSGQYKRTTWEHEAKPARHRNECMNV